MQQKDSQNNFESILKFISDTAKHLEKNYSKFGYRERIQIERCLFLLLKILCNKKLECNLQGFSKDHIDRVCNFTAKNEFDIRCLKLIEKAFELKVFIVRLSCENAYVRGDSISKLGLNSKNVHKTILTQLNSISNKAYFLMKYI